MKSGMRACIHRISIQSWNPIEKLLLNENYRCGDKEHPNNEFNKSWPSASIRNYTALDGNEDDNDDGVDDEREASSDAMEVSYTICTVFSLLYFKNIAIITPTYF